SPRRLNLLCDQLLEEGRAAGTSVITADLVRRTARSASEAPAAAAVTHDAVDGAGPDPAVGPVQPPWWMRRIFWLPAAGILLAGGLGAGWGWSIANGETDMPIHPNRPAIRIGPGFGALPIPSDDEIRSLLDGTWIGSGQLPDDRHNLD